MSTPSPSARILAEIEAISSDMFTLSEHPVWLQAVRNHSDDLVQFEEEDDLVQFEEEDDVEDELLPDLVDADEVDDDDGVWPPPHWVARLVAAVGVPAAACEPA